MKSARSARQGGPSVGGGSVGRSGGKLMTDGRWARSMSAVHLTRREGRPQWRGLGRLSGGALPGLPVGNPDSDSQWAMLMGAAHIVRAGGRPQWRGATRRPSGKKGSGQGRHRVRWVTSGAASAKGGPPGLPVGIPDPDLGVESWRVRGGPRFAGAHQIPSGGVLLVRRPVGDRSQMSSGRDS